MSWDVGRPPDTLSCDEKVIKAFNSSLSNAALLLLSRARTYPPCYQQGLFISPAPGQMDVNSNLESVHNLTRNHVVQKKAGETMPLVKSSADN